MIKINLAGEFLTRFFYDDVIVLSNVLVAVLPVGLGVAVAVFILTSEWLDSAAAPLMPGDRVQILMAHERQTIRGRKGKIITIRGEHVDVEIALESPRTVCKPAKGCRRMPADFSDRGLVQVEVHRHLVKRVMTVQTLRCCAGLLRQVLVCMRAICCRANRESSSKDTTQGEQPNHLKNVAETAEMEADIEPDLDLKSEALKMARPRLEPLLEARGIKWDAAKKAAFMLTDLSAIQNVLDDPEKLIKLALSLGTNAALQHAFKKLRPALEPTLMRKGMKWEDMLPALELIDTLDEIDEAIADPEAFL
eukprot:SAG31_NODE_8832_length_1379_cov_0.995313_2_plen_306_part_01